MKFWLVIYRIASIAFVAVVVVAIVSAFLPKIRQNQARQRKITEIEDENRRKEEAINRLRKQQDRLDSDPKYVERLAREELGKAKAGETVYRFSRQKTNEYLRPRRK